jgi:hypothetical protein
VLPVPARVDQGNGVFSAYQERGARRGGGRGRARRSGLRVVRRQGARGATALDYDLAGKAKAIAAKLGLTAAG